VRVAAPEVAIVDCGGANLASLSYALERLGARAHLSHDGRAIAAAERVLLPGVGAAAHAMERLRAAGLPATLRALTQPVLGICLGMQLLFAASEEGPTECLGLLPGAVARLTPAPGRPVPHMGWNELEPLAPDPLLEGVRRGDHAYFVHGYAAALGAHTLASVDYGSALSAVVRRANFWGTQFHPERSASVGATVLGNFLRLS
jgi:imidazole glycerol-phosphate synthase subunit HisH